MVSGARLKVRRGVLGGLICFGLGLFHLREELREEVGRLFGLVRPARGYVLIDLQTTLCHHIERRHTGMGEIGLVHSESSAKEIGSCGCGAVLAEGQKRVGYHRIGEK